MAKELDSETIKKAETADSNPAASEITAHGIFNSVQQKTSNRISATQGYFNQNKNVSLGRQQLIGSARLLRVGQVIDIIKTLKRSDTDQQKRNKTEMLHYIRPKIAMQCLKKIFDSPLDPVRKQEAFSYFNPLHLTQYFSLAQSSSDAHKTLYNALVENNILELVATTPVKK